MINESCVRDYRDNLQTLLNHENLEDARHGRQIVEALSWVLGENDDFNQYAERARAAASNYANT